MKPTFKQKLLASILAVTMVVGTVGGNLSIVSAADSPPMTGSEARKPNQPKFSGYRVWDIRDWTPAEDPGSEFLRARIPLQGRITPFQPTQANPDLDSKAQIMLMQGDYGNAFVDGMMYNNTFNYHTLNFWQYTDYFSPWHGAASATTPEDLYDPDFEATAYRGWETRFFEFGVLNIPNPAYTNAAHKNGVKSIACIYFDQYYRQGQTINELFVQDEDGTFPVAEKLIEMAKYFGYDGYFFNAEEEVEPRFEIPKKQFLARLKESGLWTQYYDTNSAMDDAKAKWLTDTIDGQETVIQDSVFVNYEWPGNLDKAGKNFTYLAEHPEIDPFQQVFYGFENNQAKFSGGHPSAKSTSIAQLYAQGTKNPRASIALFTPSDFYQRGDGIDGDMLNDPDSQWKIAERERMFFSGVTSNPTDTGAHAGYKRTDVGVDNAGDWVGVADFTSERSVIDSSTFYTNFNVGKGMQYFTNGSVTGNDAWTNITVQDLLPTWQWWIETAKETKLNVLNAEEATSAIAKVDEATAPIASVTPVEATGPVVSPDETGKKLKVDFDYGEKYYTGATSFEHVGAYNGGSSLVVTGKLETENLLRLYKTDLDVTANSAMEVTYQKPSASDGSEMKLALIFMDDPDTVVYLPIPGTGTVTHEWTTKSVDLSKYAGKKIATIGLAFNNKQANVEKYQMNIGALRLTDGQDHTPATPTGFTVDRAFTSDEAIVSWDIDSFDTVDTYEVYANLSNGKRVFLGSNYDDIHYIKSLMNENKTLELELIAIGKDGTRSAPATVSYSFDDKVSKLASKDVTTEIITTPDPKDSVTGHITKAAETGILELSWQNPKADYKELQIEVTMDDSDDNVSFQKTVAKGVTSTQIAVRRGHGESYQAAVSTVLADGTVTEPILLTGKLKDAYSAPYSADKVSVSGTKATFWCPDPNDWLKLHASVNGQALIFSNRFGRFDAEYAVRAATLMSTTLPIKTGVIEVVLEDYAGNFSAPIYIPYGELEAEINETLVPDSTLREAIRTQAGTTVGEIVEYTGDLDLSGKSISDFTGLEMLGRADTLNLSGTNVTKVEQGMLSGGFRKLDVSNCTKLTRFGKGSFTSLGEVEELDITGCTALEIVNVADSSLEKITYGDASSFTKLMSADLSGAKLDMTSGTPERIFADAIMARSQNADSFVYESTILENASTSGTLEAETNVPNAGKLIDGDLSNYAKFTVGTTADFVVSFAQPVQIYKWAIVNYGLPTYGLTDYSIQYSNDKNVWHNLGTPITASSSDESQMIVNPVAAKYYRVNATATAAKGGYVREIQLFKRMMITYPTGVKFDNQRPEAYVTYPESQTLNVNQGVVNVKNLASVKTIRGTAFAALAGADFIDEAYDLQSKLNISDEVAFITNPNSVVSANKLDTSTDSTYQVDYVSFDTPVAEGEVKKSIQLIVGDGGIVIPPEDKVSVTMQLEGKGTVVVDFDGIRDLTANSPVTFQLDKSSQAQTLTLWGTNDNVNGETVLQSISGGTITKTERTSDENGMEITKYTLKLIPSADLNINVKATLPEVTLDHAPTPNKEISIPGGKIRLPNNLEDFQSVEVRSLPLDAQAPVVKAAASTSFRPLFGWDLEALGIPKTGEASRPINGVRFELNLGTLPALERNQSYVLYHLSTKGWNRVQNATVVNGILTFTVTDGYSPYVLGIESSRNDNNSDNSSKYFGGGAAGFSFYWITAKAGENGTVTPAGETKVKTGGSLTYTFTPNAGYVVDRVLLDNEKEVTLVNGTYTFKNADAPYTITATFKKAGASEGAQPNIPGTAVNPIAPNPATGDSNPIAFLMICIIGLAICIPTSVRLIRKRL